MTGPDGPAPAAGPVPAAGQAPAAGWPDRLQLGEGARWVDGRLVLVDILTGRLLAGRVAGQPLQVLAELGVPLGAVAPVHGAPASWIAAAGTGVCILGPDGAISWACDVAQSAPAAVRVNDGAADAAGRFWFGTMACDGGEQAGPLQRVDHDGTVTRVLDRITIPNGPAFSADGATMYLADSARGLVHRYHVDPATGALGEGRLFADFTGLPGSPDGMTVDGDGGVWIACWGGSAVRRYRPHGTPDRVIELPASQPAAVCLGGPDGRLLHVTTATHGLSSPAAHDGAVFTVPVQVPGPAAAAFRPRGPLAALASPRRAAGPGTAGPGAGSPGAGSPGAGGRAGR